MATEIAIDECCAYCGIHFDDDDTHSVTENELGKAFVCKCCAQSIVDYDNNDIFPPSYKKNVLSCILEDKCMKSACVLCGEELECIVLYVCEACICGDSYDPLSSDDNSTGSFPTGNDDVLTPIVLTVESDENGKYAYNVENMSAEQACQKSDIVKGLLL